MSRPLRVFLCHSSNDKLAVRELYQKLRAEPWIQPWLDEEELYPGQDWNMEIEKVVESTDVVLVCLSNNSINKRGFVQKELRFALDVALEMPEETIFIVPLRLEECAPPRSLREWQYADYFEGQRERALERLLISLKKRASSLGLKIEQLASVEEKKLIIETPKSEFLAHPTSEWIATNKIILSNGMEFMRVSAGKFLMGEKSEQHSRDIFYDYWMARYPVTNELYNAYSKAKGIKHPVNGWEKKKDHPVTYIKWADAMAYCQWLNSLRKAEVPSGLVLRLPTEPEWEKAARGTDGREYPWGNQFDKNKCNTNEGGKGGTTSVGFYSTQGDAPYSCADMSGNVWEWAHSLEKAYPYNIKDGHEDEKASVARVLRGGSFYDNEGYARCACRVVVDFDYFSNDLGFRVVASPVPF